MDYWNYCVWFFKDMPPLFYLDIIIIICGFYILVIGPICFNYWIIPKIEHRYGVNLKFEMNKYAYLKGGSWFLSSSELAIYIFCLYTNLRLPILKNKHAVLRKINYDINTATKSEVVMSVVTVFFTLSVVLLEVSGKIWLK